jgi:hypothetical protein
LVRRDCLSDGKPAGENLQADITLEQSVRAAALSHISPRKSLQ